eukprot:12180460-Prorocentrum_lima.AAC.1
MKTSHLTHLGADRESPGSLSDPEEWTTSQIVGFIIDVIKDEFPRLQDWDFALTLHPPSQLDVARL